MAISRTQTVEIEAPAAAVFDVVSKVENLPRWATAFCARVLSREGPRYRIQTPQGNLLFWIEPDRHRGTVDMYGGPNEAEAIHWPARVLGASNDRSVFLFTAFRSPNMTDEQFEGQCAALGHELQSLKRLVEAGDPSAG